MILKSLSQKKKDAMYAITSEWPGGITKAPSLSFTLKEITSKKLSRNVTSIELFGLKKIKSCTFEHTTEGLIIIAPDRVSLPSDIERFFKINIDE